MSSYPAPSPVEGLRYQIRPLSTGEVLDRTLSLYRGVFWLCLGIAIVPATVSMLSGISHLLYLKVRHLSPLTPAYSSPVLIGMTLFWLVVSYMAFGLASAALTWVTAQVYLGRPAAFRAAYRVALHHWFRYPALHVMQTLQAGWLSIVIYALMFASLSLLRSRVPLEVAGLVTGLLAFFAMLSLVYSVYRYIKISFGMPASVLESLPVQAALRRSRALLPARKGRIVVLLLLIGAFYLVVGTAVIALQLFAMRSNSHAVLAQACKLLTTFFASILLHPLFTIAICLFYYDERVRLEGFDIQFLMEQSRLAATSSSVTTAPLAQVL